MRARDGARRSGSFGTRAVRLSVLESEIRTLLESLYQNVQRSSQAQGSTFPGIIPGFCCFDFILEWDGMSGMDVVNLVLFDCEARFDCFAL